MNRLLTGLLAIFVLSFGTANGAFGSPPDAFDPAQARDARLELDPICSWELHRDDDMIHDRERERNGDAEANPDRSRKGEDRRRQSAAESDRDDSDDSGNSQDSDTGFDGSEFQAPTFIDTDFRKRLYRDSFRTNLDPVMTLYPRMRFAAARKRLSVRDHRISAPGGVDGRGDNRGNDTWQKLTEPIPGMLRDWVPDKVDRLQNGGFANSPDNGAPVPYRLNGHIDIERGLPWEPES